MANQLTPYLLDRSLVDYTEAVVFESLRSCDDSTKKKRATLALEFFKSILDAVIKEEKDQLDVFTKYHAALDDLDIAKSLLETQPDRPSVDNKQVDAFDLTPAQQVLTLPDTLDVIFSHISTLSKSTRDTLHAGSLTSISFHYAAQLRLWRRPRDLDTVEQQVRFAFGVAISSALGESLGQQVKRLRIRLMKGAWNARLVSKIVELCPALVDLTLHWGDAVDGSEQVTSDNVRWLFETLGRLPSLRYLHLVQFSAADIAAGITVPDGAHIPFSQLEELQLYGFHWYWDAIEQGVGSKLKSLDLGLGTLVTSAQLVVIARKVTSLTELRLGRPVELDHIRLFTETAPALERVEITSFDERDDAYVSELYSIVTGLKDLKEVSLSPPAGPAQIIQLAKSPSPLEDVWITVQENSDEEAVKAALLQLLTAKKSTLKKVYELSSVNLGVSDQFVEALAACPGLEKIGINFDAAGTTVSRAVVEKLLTQCSRLTLTDGLETLVAGNALYEEKYKQDMARAQQAEDEELSEDLLGN
ncbi:hypothetical protein M413DRAFT_327191 [Hebeloma cylindrosporum]|uniref:Uncharacterized protein n=1 Tax=Hebeloma cylindrosporum TaxID=76867 RepID=A0A0C2XCS8_HEBCY|nr:hypothetical protein M413DRAFT_327191 [Hebeloma cylindrosporum h7]